MKLRYFSPSVIFLLANIAHGYTYDIGTGTHFMHLNLFEDFESAKQACFEKAETHGYSGEQYCAQHSCDDHSCMIGAGWLWQEKDTQKTPFHFVQNRFPRYYAEAPESGNNCPSVGNPISVTSGKKIQAHEDIIISGLPIKRFYQSGSAIGESVIGYNWRTTLDIEVNKVKPKFLSEKAIADSTTPSFPTTRGSKEQACAAWRASVEPHFSDAYIGATGQTSPLSSSICELVKDGNVLGKLIIRNTFNIPSPELGDFISIQHPSGEEYFFANKDGKQYEIYGKKAYLEIDGNNLILNLKQTKYLFVNQLLSSINLNGKTYTIERDDNNLVAAIYLATNEIASFEYDESFRITKVTSEAGDLVYNYSEGNTLDSVLLNNQDIYSYKYLESTSLLTEVLQGGALVAKWSYDDKGRAISSEHANGTDKYTVDYTGYETASSPKISVTGPLNKKTTYHYSYIDGQRKITQVEGHASDNCAAANKAYTYYDNGTLKTKTDWQGRVTEFTRDEYGREIERIEAKDTTDARTIKTEWHPTLNVKTKVIEPKTTTEWEYFDDGKLKSTKTYATAN